MGGKLQHSEPAGHNGGEREGGGFQGHLDSDWVAHLQDTLHLYARD